MLNATLRSVIELPNTPSKKKKTLHSILPNENNLFDNFDFVANNKQRKLLFSDKPDISFVTTNVKMEPTSPILPLSNIFHSTPLPNSFSKNKFTILKNDVVTKSSALDIYNISNPSNTSNTSRSRIVIAKCHEPMKLISLLQCYFKSTDITIDQLPLCENVSCVTIGWYDIRDVSPQTNYLQKLIVKHALSDVTINPAFLKEPLIQDFLNNPKFKLLEDCFATIYLYFPKFKILESVVDLIQQEAYNHLMKFGSVNEILFLQNFNCFACKFYNVKTSFIVTKLGKVSINQFQVHIFQTLIDLKEYIIKTSDNLFVDLFTMKYHQFSQIEWSKYHWLQFRRLGTLPFINSIENSRTQNKIDLGKIYDGNDNRVTLMIKNIPNKLKHEDLKEIVDQTSYGDYNFLYLRIDFKNQCNVGYAFISFKSPLHIIKFYRARNNETWPKFKSNKVCQLAYAKIQGFDNLVQKFKNSKVMIQNHDYHPKIYYTEGSKKGQEMSFPL